ncbi:MAG: chorismate synthase [Planctomycetes bacterium]|nr:chorismate synthase [Planctomycetota bacterium]
MTAFTWRTAGESHGKTLIGMLEGLPAGLPLDVERVNTELRRRQGGYGRGGRMKIEQDHVVLLSGIKGGETLGTPLAFEVPNRDQTLESLPKPISPRPGHVDLAGCWKYEHRDARAVLERASARETAARVAAAGLVRQLLESFGIRIFGHVVALGAIQADSKGPLGSDADAVRQASPFYCLDPKADAGMKQAVDQAKAEGDTLGGVFEVRVEGLPPGLGGFGQGSERLTSTLGAALFSIPAIKGVEFGLGFEAARLPGSSVHDGIVSPGGVAGVEGSKKFTRSSNRAGGLEGGLTNGQCLIVRAAMKPISTLRQGLPSIDFETGEPEPATYQRSDVTAVPAASVVGEAVVALELCRAFLAKFGGDSMVSVQSAYSRYMAQVRGL